MTTDKQITHGEDLASLPLGLLLGRVSAGFRIALLNQCDGTDGDVRLIGLAMAIKNNPNASQASYARYLGIDLNTASRLINRAEDMKLLSRVPSPADKRAFVLELSEAGHALAAQGARAIEGIEAAIEDQIGEKTFEEFRRTAEQILRLMS